MFPIKKGGSPKPHPTPAGPGGTFDPNDSPGQDENHDGIFGRPVKRATHAKLNPALAGLKGAKPK